MLYLKVELAKAKATESFSEASFVQTWRMSVVCENLKFLRTEQVMGVLLRKRKRSSRIKKERNPVSSFFTKYIFHTAADQVNLQRHRHRLLRRY